MGGRGEASGGSRSRSRVGQNIRSPYSRKAASHIISNNSDSRGGSSGPTPFVPTFELVEPFSRGAHTRGVFTFVRFLTAGLGTLMVLLTMAPLVAYLTYEAFEVFAPETAWHTIASCIAIVTCLTLFLMMVLMFSCLSEFPVDKLVFCIVNLY